MSDAMEAREFLREDDVVSTLRRNMEECLAKAEKYRQMIAVYEGQTSASTTTVSGQYADWKPKEAMRDYMMHRPHAKVSLKQIVADLLAAGVRVEPRRGRQTDQSALIEWQLKISMNQMHKRPLYDVEPKGKLDGVDPRDIFITLKRK